MTKHTEVTSARIARLAGRILAIEDEPPANEWRPSWKEIRALAASALTQAADKPSIRFHHWGNEPGEAPGPKRKNGRIRVAKFRTRNPKGLKKARRK